MSGHKAAWIDRWLGPVPLADAGSVALAGAHSRTSVISPGRRRSLEGADRLVDKLHLFVFPLAIGAGQRLFAEGAGATRFELAGCEAFDNGALHLSYRAAEPARRD